MARLSPKVAALLHLSSAEESSRALPASPALGDVGVLGGGRSDGSVVVSCCGSNEHLPDAVMVDDGGLFRCLFAIHTSSWGGGVCSGLFAQF